ncbi:hypothetical protein [Sphingomonas sp. CLY1604]|uniref:hypothetical protein n=1 Tax=Sphingomonas sp. CLY1604 TaxID=3457786 RepID=UPI003FD85391
MVSGLFDRIATWLSSRDGGSAAAAHLSVPAVPAVSSDDGRLPDASRPRVARLVSLIDDIEARPRDNGAMVSALAEMRQMRDTHLPRLIASYAEIPAAHRAEIFRETGRSASYNLNEALDRMINRAETLSRSMAQDDIDSFADNLRFIEQRYGDDDQR